MRWLGYVARMREIRIARRKPAKLGGMKLLLGRTFMRKDVIKTNL